MKYDIKVTINVFRHIFTFKGNNKFFVRLIQIFFFSAIFYCPYHAINKSIFVYLTTLCKMFFSPWKWHLKSKRNIYANLYGLLVVLYVLGIIFLFPIKAFYLLANNLQRDILPCYIMCICQYD